MKLRFWQTSLWVAVLLNFSGLAFAAHLGDTPDQIRREFGPPTGTFQAGEAPPPADLAYSYLQPGLHFCVTFYFQDSRCGEIRILRFKDAGPFSINDIKADFEAYTGVSSEGCSTVDDDDYKAIFSRESKCIARTPDFDLLTLYIEDFRFFAYEVAAGSMSGN